MGRSILAALAATAAFVSAPASATIVIKSWSVGPALVGRVNVASKNLHTGDIYVGDFHLKGKDSATGAVFDQTTNCVDLEHYIANGSYELLSASVRVTDVTRLRQLTAFVTNGRQQVTSSASAAAAKVKAAALQLGIWELLYETGSAFDVKAGNFSSTGSQLAGSQTLANTWLSKTTSREWRPLAGQKLDYLYNAGLQSQMFVAPLGQGEQGVGGVPEPTSWAMLIGGFLSIGAAARRRRPMLAAA